MEEIKPSEWAEKVYRAELKDNLDKLYKKPGYDESDL
jgi:4-oxalocrotonate tautomerase